ncbi:cyclophilin-like family protein [Streptomyces sp. NPDC001268]|uniref:cyclophilin-like family protein n=1 Tax=Streptomyces sp. NPDC001268 TaxID=3364553 RepID=UPI0036AD4287
MMTHTKSEPASGVPVGAHRPVGTWGGQLTATIDDTPTGTALAGVLPVSAPARVSGEEVHFRVFPAGPIAGASAPLPPALEADVRQVVEPGTVAFWTEGDAPALPCGPTPVSPGDECRPASHCHTVGRRVDGDPRVLATVRPGDPVHVERATD